MPSIHERSPLPDPKWAPKARQAREGGTLPRLNPKTRAPNQTFFFPCLPSAKHRVTRGEMELPGDYRFPCLAIILFSSDSLSWLARQGSKCRNVSRTGGSMSWRRSLSLYIYMFAPLEAGMQRRRILIVRIGNTRRRGPGVAEGVVVCWRSRNVGNQAPAVPGVEVKGGAPCDHPLTPSLFHPRPDLPLR